jgi:hypothetical protein
MAWAENLGEAIVELFTEAQTPAELRLEESFFASRAHHHEHVKSRYREWRKRLLVRKGRSRRAYLKAEGGMLVPLVRDAVAAGISPGAFYMRIVRGMAPREAATRPKSRKGNPRNPMLDLARQNGIGREAYYSRLRKGMTPEEAATKPPRKYTRRS